MDICIDEIKGRVTVSPRKAEQDSNQWCLARVTPSQWDGRKKG